MLRSRDPLPCLIISAALWGLAFPPAGSASVGPAAPPDGTYGYLVQAGPPCAVWWAEGAYKVVDENVEGNVAAAIERLTTPGRNSLPPAGVSSRASGTWRTRPGSARSGP